MEYIEDMNDYNDNLTYTKRGRGEENEGTPMIYITPDRRFTLKTIIGWFYV